MTLTVLQIVPRRSTIADGVGDYATILADRLFEVAGIRSIFLQCAPETVWPIRDQRWPTSCLSTPRSTAFQSDVNAIVQAHRVDALLVHISLYGYQRRGVPTWLVRGLEAIKRKRAMPIAAIFHETWAGDSATPLQSSYWLWRLQRYLIGRLLTLSDYVVTTTGGFKRALLSLQKSIPKEVIVENVFSNVGEPEVVAPVADRARRLVVFGGPSISVLDAFGALQRFAEAAGIGHIVDIGRRSAPPPVRIGEVPVTAAGALPAEEVSRRLADCRYGVVPYSNRAVFGKSTIIAAYAAHGVLPVVFAPTHADSDGLCAGQTYLAADDHAVAHPQAVQERLLAWYGQHDSRRQAASLAQALFRLRRQAA